MLQTLTAMKKITYREPLLHILKWTALYKEVKFRIWAFCSN